MAANNAPNMKVVVGADTSQFDKGMRAAKAQVRDFSKVSSDALSKLGEAFGVNTAQIEKVTNAIGGLGQRMSQAGSEGTKAFGNLLSSVTKLNTGLVGLGLLGWSPASRRSMPRRRTSRAPSPAPTSNSRRRRTSTPTVRSSTIPTLRLAGPWRSGRRTGRRARPGSAPISSRISSHP